jgi:hypothetical protein
MTKKDYIKIADTLSEYISDKEPTFFKEIDTSFKVGKLISLFTKMLREDNPKFDENKFYKHITTKSSNLIYINNNR